MPTYAKLILIIPFVFVFIALITLIVKIIKLSTFKKNNPDYVKMRIFSSSSSSSYTIKIFSVNDQKPQLNLNKTTLYLLPGKNHIIAQYESINEDQTSYEMIGDFIGGIIGVIIEIFSLAIATKNIRKEKPENGITIDIETKRNVCYEMKADPYEEVINIICSEGEKYEIKSYN